MLHFSIRMALLFVCCASFSLGKPLKVAATTAELGAIVREIGGSEVKVQVLAPSQSDPHFIDAKPSLILHLRKAELLVTGGAGLEDAWLPPLVLKSRNKHIQKGGSGYLEAAEGISLLEIPEAGADRSQGDVHPYGNPHFMTTPKNANTFGVALAQKLGSLLPDKREAFAVNLKAYEEALNRLQEKYRNTLKGVALLGFHKSYEYMAEFTGATIEGYLEPKPGIPPSPAHLSSLLPIIKNRSVACILLQPYQREKSAKFLMEKTGAPYYYLSIFPEDESASYTSFLQSNYEKLLQYAKGEKK